MTATLARSAFRYAAHGWRILPAHGLQNGRCTCGAAACDHPGKHPRNAKGFLAASNDEHQVREWWTRWPGSNIALWPGPSGLLVIDIDGPKGRAAARKFGLLDVQTLRCTTGRADGGEHAYFRHPSFEVGNRDLADHLEIRCDAGYVILPPSVHASGTVYQWQRAAVAELPVLAMEALRKAQAPQAPAPVVPPPSELPSTSELERRIRAYIQALPAGLSAGDGRNVTAFSLAAWLQRDLALPESEAAAWVREWNSGNIEPLPERELRMVIHSAQRNGKHPVGSGLGRLVSPRPSREAVRDVGWQDALTKATGQQVAKVSSRAISRLRWEDALARATSGSDA